eukprot:m.163771 g.163771  ORF g.163771 m.163771 type:complete len:76 (+) comp16395_c0_seq2:387-614(+)
MVDNTLATLGKPCHELSSEAVLSASPHVAVVLGPVAESVIAHPAISDVFLPVQEAVLFCRVARAYHQPSFRRMDH